MDRFELLSRPDCHLCEAMEEVLSVVLPAFGESFVIRNVDSKKEWKHRYGEVIPVLLRDGLPVAKTRLDTDTLERIIQGRRSSK